MVRNAQATQERLIGAAREAFSELGYERTTVREIARRAGTNPALINRYFGGKEQLFAQSVAIQLDFPDLATADREKIGETLIAHFFRRWEGGAQDDLLRMLVRTAATNEESALRIRAILAEQVSSMVGRVSGPQRARERACLIATQILGLAYTRYILGFTDEDVSRNVMLKMVGGTIQRYLFDELP